MVKFLLIKIPIISFVRLVEEFMRTFCHFDFGIFVIEIP